MGALQTMRLIFGYACVMWRRPVDLLHFFMWLWEEETDEIQKSSPRLFLGFICHFGGPVFGKSALLNAAWDRF